MDLVDAEMTERGVDVQHQWGKLKAERHDRLPRVLWTESDEDERISDPWQSRYDIGTTQADASYDRAVKLEVTVLGRDEAESEAILDVLLAAGRQKLTMSAWTPTRIQKRGERPSSGGHARVLDVTVQLPVLDIIYSRGTIATTSIEVSVTEMLGMSEFFGFDFEDGDFD
jgi:hypothetical protein